MSEQETRTAELPALPGGVAENPVLQAARAVPFRVAVSVPLAGVTLRRLRGLRVKDVLVSAAAAAEDVALFAGGIGFAWAELDSVDGRMAARMTRLR